ncbi:hypothetical protein Q7P37_006775 [Cladosporium fusiforme]
MESFAQFQQPPMASNPQDFTLYASYWDTERPFPQQPIYNDHNLMGYPTTEPYNNGMTDAYAMAPGSFEQQHEPRYDCPAKADFSFEYQPPVLSSTSDSGASVQSAMSSKMGSPSAQAQSSNDWNQQFNMFPSIVQNENGLTTSGMEFSPLTVLDNKGCVAFPGGRRRVTKRDANEQRRRRLVQISNNTRILNIPASSTITCLGAGSGTATNILYTIAEALARKNALSALLQCKRRR